MNSGEDRAAAMACRMIAAQGVNALPVDPAALLRSCRHTHLLTYAQAAQALGCDEAQFEREHALAEAWTCAATLQNGERWYTVCYRPGGNAARLRFSLAHELGHIALRHTGESPGEEREADCFALHLLCPRPVIRRLLEREETLYAEQVAKLCFVSPSAALTLRWHMDVRIAPELEKKVDELLSPCLPGRLPESRLMPRWRPIFSKGEARLLREAERL